MRKTSRIFFENAVKLFSAALGTEMSVDWFNVLDQTETFQRLSDGALDGIGWK